MKLPQKAAGRARCDHAACDAEQSQVGFCFLLPADENTTETIHPTVYSFHQPTLSLEPRFALDRQRLLSARPDLGGELEFFEKVSHIVVEFSNQLDLN